MLAEFYKLSQDLLILLQDIELPFDVVDLLKCDRANLFSKAASCKGAISREIITETFLQVGVSPHVHLASIDASMSMPFQDNSWILTPLINMEPLQTMSLESSLVQH